jgi:hypothetical protein
MRATRWVKVAGALGICLLGLPILRLWWNRPGTVARIEGRPMSRRHRDAAEQTLWQARHWRAHAIIAVNRDRDALETWDPAGLDGINDEAWRVQWMAADPTGDLHRARTLAERAVTLARNPGQKYGAVEFLVLLDHDRGDHQAALAQARRLMALCPHSDRARMVLRLAVRSAAQDPASRAGGPACTGEPANVKNRGSR